MMARPLRICLAASGGGHLRQLLDLEAVWGAHDHFFVTTDYSLGRSVAAAHRTHFVAEYGFGMWHQGKRWTMMRQSSRNFFQALGIIIRERPQLVITTGAAAIFWTILLARLFGARLVSIESFARMEAPSVYGGLVRPFAHQLIVQSEKLKAYWPEAEVFDPLVILDQPRPEKEALVFVTVGALTPFDRMVDAVIALKQDGVLLERVIAQVGHKVIAKTQKGAEIELAESFDFSAIQDILRRAEIVICHGGTGSIITALRAGCRVVAMPRRFDLGEAFDDHQQEIVNSFAARGLLEMADDADDLPAAIARARSKKPVMATTDPQVLRAYLNNYIARLIGEPVLLDHSHKRAYRQHQQAQR